MEKRIAEPFELSPAPFHQRAHDHVAPDHVVFVLPERNLVETRMRVGVIGEVEAGVEPLLEHHGTGVALARDVQLPLVDEDRRRDFFSGERSDQTVRDALKTFQVSHLADHRPIVYGYGARGARAAPAEWRPGPASASGRSAERCSTWRGIITRAPAVDEYGGYAPAGEKATPVARRAERGSASL